jgi:hypothetical protein
MVRKFLLFLVPVILIAVAGCESEHFWRSRSKPGISVPGPKSDGSVLLPNQWSIRPGG